MIILVLIIVIKMKSGYNWCYIVNDWPQLIFRKDWFNFSTGVLVVALGWPAGLNT